MKRKEGTRNDNAALGTNHHGRALHRGDDALPLSPFILFSSRRPTPRYIQYLGATLPAAIFAMLVVYCLKGVDLFSGTHGLPEFIAIAATVLLHLWKRNMMISMAGGTAVYMFLVQMVFV